MTLWYFQLRDFDIADKDVYKRKVPVVYVASTIFPQSHNKKITTIKLAFAINWY